MSRRLLDYDATQRLATYHDYDHQTRTTYIEYVQDVEEHLDFSKDRQNDQQYKRDGIKRNRMHFAHIPVIVQMEWMTKYGVRMWDKNHEKKVFALLNSPEYRHLRTVDKGTAFKVGA